MASTSYAATKEMTNINRVSRLLMDPCTDQLRDLLRFYIPPANFNSVIQTAKSRLPRLTEPQRKLILPNSGMYSGNYDDMDISLLYILLRNVCGIQAHNKGWGNTSDSADRSVSANIERFRLARNRCGHSTGGMSNSEFNQVWSEIRAAVVDLDKTLGIGNKYQEAVDFIRNDTMDPTKDRHFRDQLLEQIIETENIKKDVHILKTKTKENDEQVTEVKQDIIKLESSQKKIDERNIPLNIQEQNINLLESWLKGDKPFHEIHSFSNILDKVQSQSITTIIGGPGSGKTTTARHLALRLQTECEFEIVPIDDITEIKQYGHPKCKQLFILDDVIGVFCVEYSKLTNLTNYRERILYALGERSKVLFTCRKAVYNEAANLKSFVFDNLIDLEDSNNQLNAEDRKQILNNHCKQNDISLKPDELPHVSSTVGCMIYPLLCKLFCSKSEYQALGKKFFENPYVCISKEMDHLQGHKKLYYASLIMCMFCQNEKNEITEMMTKKDPRFMEIREKVFENCGVSGRNSEIKDALDHMINTFTIRTDKRYSLIHDSVYEVLAFHYGNQHQEDMLEYMSSSFVAKKFSICDTSCDPGDLLIKLHKEHYSAFAKRLGKFTK
uniref:Uncharacterized protein LOC111115920 isoform X1 n=1 Tax=Crassostrea virginica TaxID=6565 RepID=A0A8B8C5Z8_CRAVI|nr:uncharacterized protein LOC111115920 isoform X1 [Crassostrea virginica]